MVDQYTVFRLDPFNNFLNVARSIAPGRTLENNYMTTQTNHSRILLYEGIGFFSIIVLSWLSEFSDLPSFVGSTAYVPNWRESTLETVIVLLVATPVMTLTKRFVTRLHYVEGFLRVCAWCKKMEHDGKWISLEEFFDSKFQTETSHGMCLACMDDMTAKIRAARAV
jgi:hypothetical protein